MDPETTLLMGTASGLSKVELMQVVVLIIHITHSIGKGNHRPRAVSHFETLQFNFDTYVMEAFTMDWGSEEQSDLWEKPCLYLQKDLQCYSLDQSLFMLV